jgi:hypothetical protein
MVITRLWPKLELVWSIPTNEGRTEEIHAAIRLMRNVRKINWAWRCLVESSLAWIAYRLTAADCRENPTWQNIRQCDMIEASAKYYVKNWLILIDLPDTRCYNAY